MMLVLQGVCECAPPSVNFLQLEHLVAMVVQPYLGFQGLYMGTPEPLVKSSECSKTQTYAFYKNNSMYMLTIVCNILSILKH